MKSLLLGIAASLALGTAFAQTTSPAPAPPTRTVTPAPMTTAPMASASSNGISPTSTSPASTLPSGSAAASGNSNQAVATTHADAPMPAKGANSFTQSQASSRIHDRGFSNISGLAKDGDGIWRGHADKGGTTTTVWLDYKGNVGTP